MIDTRTILGVLTLALFEFTGIGQPSIPQSNTKTTNTVAILIKIKERLLSISDLDQLARDYLRTNNLMTTDHSVDAIVHINALDKTNLCTFFYHGGFGEQTWKVRIGHDGVVKGAETSIKLEQLGPRRNRDK
jgi:hypothetical protein